MSGKAYVFNWKFSLGELYKLAVVVKLKFTQIDDEEY